MEKPYHKSSTYTIGLLILSYRYTVSSTITVDALCATRQTSGIAVYRGKFQSRSISWRFGVTLRRGWSHSLCRLPDKSTQSTLLWRSLDRRAIESVSLFFICLPGTGTVNT